MQLQPKAENSTATPTTTPDAIAADAGLLAAAQEAFAMARRAGLSVEQALSEAEAAERRLADFRMACLRAGRAS